MVYKEIDYDQDQQGKWYYVMPSGMKAYPKPPAASEEAIKVVIDQFLALASGG